MKRPVWRRVRVIALAVMLVGLVRVSGALAGEFYETGGLAIRGYDPVAYFAEQRPVQGSTRYTSSYLGSMFHFATAENRAAFQANPARFAPQYGGFCAYGMALGYKAKIEPDAFTIVEGKLYLNYDRSVRDRWSRDIAGHIKKADRNWPTVRTTTKVAQ